MTAICAGQRINHIDLESAEVGLVAAPCCCTVSLVTGCLGVHFMINPDIDMPWPEAACSAFE
jgi:hypothetical protein